MTRLSTPFALSIVAALIGGRQRANAADAAQVCPPDTLELYRRDGTRRCVCAKPGTVCSGDECLAGHRHQDSTAMSGYPPACTNCACTEKGGIAGIQLPAAQTVRSASVSPVRIPDHIGAEDPAAGAISRSRAQSVRGPEDLEPASTSTFARRQCVQRALKKALGFDYNEKYYVMGCNTPAMTDFDHWAKETGCGSEPVDGNLLYHTAWTGPIDRYQTEFEALLDSWLMTQDTARAEFHFWYMDREADPTNPFEKHYSEISRGRIKFHRVDLHELARGTCLEGRHDYLNATVPPDWHDKRVMGPKEKADMTRILLLRQHGGIWLDTDDVLLRDLRPMIEFAGEFATQLTLSFYFNNNVLGVRKGSALSRGLVDIVCMLPYSRDTKEYCKIVGSNCYPKWYWNHGVFQIAERNHLGAITFPMSFTDPAYGCYPPMLLSAAGGQPIRNWSLDDVLELIRGAFVLHTRGYNAKKPLHPESNFAKLYKIAKDGAAKQDDAPVPIMKTAARTPAEEADYATLYTRLKPTHVEPPFQPAPPWYLIQLEPVVATSLCMYAERSPGSYGPLSITELSPKWKCTDNHTLETLEHTFDDGLKAYVGIPKSVERYTWMYHEASGYIRPAIREPGRLFCLDAERIPRPALDGPPMVGVCNPARKAQVWQLNPIPGTAGLVQFYNPHVDRCVGAIPSTNPEVKAGWAVAMAQCEPAAEVTDRQRWRMHRFKKVTHGVKYD